MKYFAITPGGPLEPSTGRDAAFALLVQERGSLAVFVPRVGHWAVAGDSMTHTWAGLGDDYAQEVDDEEALGLLRQWGLTSLPTTFPLTTPTQT